MALETLSRVRQSTAPARVAHSCFVVISRSVRPRARFERLRNNSAKELETEGSSRQYVPLGLQEPSLRCKGSNSCTPAGYHSRSPRVRWLYRTATRSTVHRQ